MSRLDPKKAEERQDTGRKEVPKRPVAKRDDSKASESGISRCSSGSTRPRGRSKAPRSTTSQKTSRENYKKPGPREYAATAHIPGFRYAASGTSTTLKGTSGRVDPSYSPQSSRTSPERKLRRKTPEVEKRRSTSRRRSGSRGRRRSRERSRGRRCSGGRDRRERRSRSPSDRGGTRSCCGH